MPKIKYTLEQRQEIIEFFNNHTIKETKEKYGIGYTTIMCWIDPQFHKKQKDYLNKIPLIQPTKSLCVINCAAEKKTFSCIASQMYDGSALFRTLRDYAQKNYDEYIIISAHYGVLKPTDIIEPYNDVVMFVPNNLLHSGKEYKRLNAEEKKEWANKIFNSVKWGSYNKVDFLVGKYYWEYLKPLFKDLKNVNKISLESGITNVINQYKTT